MPQPALIAVNARRTEELFSPWLDRAQREQAASIPERGAHIVRDTLIFDEDRQSRTASLPPSSWLALDQFRYVAAGRRRGLERA